MCLKELSEELLNVNGISMLFEGAKAMRDGKIGKK